MLDASVISREWIDSLIAGVPKDSAAPDAWQTWVRTGRRRALMSTRSLEYRPKIEQLPADKDGEAMVQDPGPFQGKSSRFRTLRCRHRAVHDAGCSDAGRDAALS